MVAPTGRIKTGTKKKKLNASLPLLDLAEYRSVFCDKSNRHSRMEISRWLAVCQHILPNGMMA